MTTHTTSSGTHTNGCAFLVEKVWVLTQIVWILKQSGEVIPMDNEMEQKKEYLRSYRKTRAEAKATQETINELRLNKMCPSMGAQDGMPKGNGSSDLSGYASRLDELERKLREKQDKSVRLMGEITDSIAEMEDATERTLLRYRYICGYTWEQIAVDLGYSWQWVHKLHARALKHFAFSAKKR